MKTWPGQPYPLGATWNGAGANFAPFSENATGVELCPLEGPRPAGMSPCPSSSQPSGVRWELVLDTREAVCPGRPVLIQAGAPMTLRPAHWPSSVSHVRETRRMRSQS